MPGPAPISPRPKKKALDKPNVLLINIDSLRADHMGFYGYEKNTSPQLDSYFARGVVFENAIATAPFTFQTDASILTSLYPSQNGVYTWKTPMRDKLLLQQMLKEEGYSTAAFVAPSLYYESRMFAYFDSFKLSEERKNLERSSEQVKEWIIKSEGPFFVFWHIYDVHLPYLRIADRFYPGTYDGPFFGSKYDTKWETQQSKTIELTDEYGNTINYTITQEDISYIRALYDNGVYLTDEGLGRVLRELEALGYLNNTILIISAEHGDDLWEHGRIFHSDIYDVNTHVPLMVLYPGCEPARIKEPVSSLDIAPTIIDFINVSVPQGFGGISLLSPGLDANRTIYSERPPFDEYSVRRGGWKYILRNPDLKANKSLEYITSIDEANRFFYILAIKDEGSGDELYDLSKDPYEKNNLIGKGHPMEAELRKLATDFREEMRKAKEDNRIGLEKVRTLPIFTYP